MLSVRPSLELRLAFAVVVEPPTVIVAMSL